MPRPKSSGGGPNRKERYEILYEQLNSKLDLLLERDDQHRQEMQRGLEKLGAQIDERFSVIEQALREVSNRLKAHEETHAG